MKESIQEEYSTLEKEYGIAKSTFSGWVKKYREECSFLQLHATTTTVFSPKEIQELHKRIIALEKENLFLKTSPWPTELEQTEDKVVFGH